MSTSSQLMAVMQAPAELEFRPSGLTKGHGRLQNTALGLTFVTQPSHVRRGAMKLRCTAVISHVYSKSSEEAVLATPLGGPAACVTGDGPVITGGKAKYQVGDVVNVNCTSAKSRPRAELLWFVNDRSAASSSLVRYPPLRFPDGEEASILGLRFSVASGHFQDDEMRLKCTATLSQVLNMSSEEIAGSSRQSSGLHVSEHRTAEGTYLPSMSTECERFSSILIVKSFNVYISINILSYKPGISLGITLI
ncbi:hypothetical protein LAZ67_2001616 [Cordylochernes scorpioides]|uniref:Ig-like domain-containing protein n=1 Tax=Cordylochernes scorpioides TaxID=51811 RepID=A0ABY6K350_9ARAC|nr:hypothetical protein LAZ67_2001616 [Cordylochernes scorpioides]